MAKRLPGTNPEENDEDEFDYSATVKQVNLLAGLVEKLEIGKCLNKISDMESMAPLLNPTVYMAGQDAVMHQAAILRGALEFKKAVVKHKEAFLKAAEAGRKRLKDPLMGFGGLEGII